jgi:hypothetical protein
MMQFNLRFDPAEIPNLAARYVADGGEKDEACFAAGRRLARGPFDRDDLRIIFRWKTNGRGISRLERNGDSEMDDAIRLALAAKTERAAIAVLCGLSGVDVPVASAIMTALRPERYTVIDFRALEALGSPTKTSVDFYLLYLTECRRLASEHRVSIRDLDRALWQWSKDRGQRETTR